ncbi:MAG: redoxin domain-containing protein [Candidatus Parvarchaeota archaeon]|nr:redoxin domain-containing protein [Candidatus Parvarchaeota archaeon]MCL5101119.1 redoxin domain-containing protein [Candidatus Parvarchaeota archaeon]
MVSIGDRAPEFSGSAVTHNGVKDLKLADFSGKWKILLFYVADFSPVCPTEVAALNKEHEKFSLNGIELIGISTDSLDSHKRLIKETLGGMLQFPLFADTDGTIGGSYGVFNLNNRLERRATIILTPSDEISYFCVSDNKIGRSTKELFRVSMALKSGDACAVNWEPKT